MATTPKLLGRGTIAASQAAATVVDGANTVPASKVWICKVVLYNTGASARVVTCGFTDSGVGLVAGEYLINAETLASLERREFGIRLYGAGMVFRAGQVTGTDVQWEVIGFEADA